MAKIADVYYGAPIPTRSWRYINHLLTYTGCGKKRYPLRFFKKFSQQWLGILQRNHTNVFSHSMLTQRYYCKSISLMWVTVISITVTPPSDFSVLKNFRTETHS